MSYNECKGCKHDENRTIGAAMEFCTYCKRASDDKFHRMHHKDLFEPLEVAHGKWVNTNPPGKSDNIVCSICGYDSIADFDYCPNCGAKMDGGKE